MAAVHPSRKFGGSAYRVRPDDGNRPEPALLAHRGPTANDIFVPISRRLDISQIHWTAASSGYFADGADWTGGVMPGAKDNAILDATGHAFTVTSTANAAVRGIQLAANATLEFTESLFTAKAGTNGGTNAGTIIDDHGTFAVGQTVNNSGGITLEGYDPYLDLLADTTLTGGGTVTLGASGAYGISRVISTGYVTLTNVDNIITGAAQLDSRGGVNLVNEAGGVIEANLPNHYMQDDLFFGSPNQNGDQITNDGLVEATPGAGIQIVNATMSGSGAIDLTEAFILVLGSTVSGQTFNLAGSYMHLENSHVSTTGTLTSSGVGAFLGVALTDSRLVFARSLTLAGGGSIRMDAQSAMVGANLAATLINVDEAISGGENIGGGKGSFDNQAAGSVYNVSAIDTGTNTVVNAGLIEAHASSKTVGWETTIKSPLLNSGTITVLGGTVVTDAAVTGAGEVVISPCFSHAGALECLSAFDGNVTFVGGHGLLGLAQSQGYTGSITGFSIVGKTTLDLGDIGFAGADEATFSGTKTSGILTVTDGTHTAHIHLIGNFLNATFVASSDGHAGTDVIAERTMAVAAPSHGLISAMAALGASAASHVHPAEVWNVREPMLSSPRVAIAYSATAAHQPKRTRRHVGGGTRVERPACAPIRAAQFDPRRNKFRIAVSARSPIRYLLHIPKLLQVHCRRLGILDAARTFPRGRIRC